MKESYGEGVATHTGLESCAGARKGMGEALTEACAGRVLSCESFGQFGVPTQSIRVEGNIGHIVNARYVPDPAQSKTPCMHRNSLFRNWEILCLASTDGEGARAVNPKGIRRRCTGMGSRTVPKYHRSPRTKERVRHLWRRGRREGDWPRAICSGKTSSEHWVG